MSLSSASENSSDERYRTAKKLQKIKFIRFNFKHSSTCLQFVYRLYHIRYAFLYFADYRLNCAIRDVPRGVVPKILLGSEQGEEITKRDNSEECVRWKFFCFCGTTLHDTLSSFFYERNAHSCIVCMQL